MVGIPHRPRRPPWNTSIVALLFASSMSMLLLYRSHLQQQTRNGLALTSNFSLSKPSCQDIHRVEQQCAFYREYCKADDDGIFAYLDLYYCRLASLKPLAVIIIIGWLAVLFTTLGLVAGEFFSVNLGSMAHHLRMSDPLAGVTILALGNGSPDIFSTFAAMKSGSSGLAVGELIGAAAFITTVVAGSMALIGPFDVVRGSLIRDGLFLMITIVFVIYIMADGYLRLWHCIVMLTLYVVYVLFVVGWHWWLARSTNKSKHAEETVLDDEENASQLPTEETSLLPAAQTRKSNKQSVDHVENTATSEHMARRGDFIHDSIDPISDEVSQTAGESEMQTLPQVLFPDLQDMKSKNLLQKTSSIISAPIKLVLKLTIPLVDHNLNPNTADGKHSLAEDWCRWLLIVQGFFVPQLAQLVVWKQMSTTPAAIVLPALVCLGVSIVFGLVVVLTTSRHHKPRWFNLLSIPGFVMSIMWISTIADEVVDVLKSLGLICNISEELLGITIFAIGNSLDDLAANISVARQKHPVMALSACFGGPLLNILLGISISGIYIFSVGVDKKHKFREINLDVDRSLFLEAGMVLLTVGIVLLTMLRTRWRFTKALGLVLIAVWVIGTITNVTLKVA